MLRARSSPQHLLFATASTVLLTTVRYLAVGRGGVLPGRLRPTADSQFHSAAPGRRRFLERSRRPVMNTGDSQDARRAAGQCHRHSEGRRYILMPETSVASFSRSCQPRRSSPRRRRFHSATQPWLTVFGLIDDRGPESVRKRGLGRYLAHGRGEGRMEAARRDLAPKPRAERRSQPRGIGRSS